MESDTKHVCIFLLSIAFLYILEMDTKHTYRHCEFIPYLLSIDFMIIFCGNNILFSIRWKVDLIFLLKQETGNKLSFKTIE